MPSSAIRWAAPFTFAIVSLLLRFGPKLLASLVLVMQLGACSTNAEPVVPSADASQLANEGEIVRFPVRNDGTIDHSQIAAISFLDSLYDFGHVDAGAVVSHRFAFRNTGAKPLMISSATSTCGCTVPVVPKTPIAVGDTASVLVRFDTEGKSGLQNKPVTLTANTYPNQTRVLVTGTVD